MNIKPFRLLIRYVKLTFFLKNNCFYHLRVLKLRSQSLHNLTYLTKQHCLMQQHPLYGGEAYKAAETGPAQIQQPQVMPQQTTLEMQAPVLGYAGGYACGLV